MFSFSKNLWSWDDIAKPFLFSISLCGIKRNIRAKEGYNLYGKNLGLSIYYSYQPTYVQYVYRNMLPIGHMYTYYAVVCFLSDIYGALCAVLCFLSDIYCAVLYFIADTYCTVQCTVYTQAIHVQPAVHRNLFLTLAPRTQHIWSAPDTTYLERPGHNISAAPRTQYIWSARTRRTQHIWSVLKV